MIFDLRKRQQLRLPLFILLFCYSSIVKAMDLPAFLKEISLSLEVSDFEYHSLSSEYELDSTLTIANKNQDNFSYLFKFFFDSDKDVNEYDGTKYSEVKIDLQQRFEHKNVFNYFLYTNYIEFAQEKVNGRYTAKYDFDIGPLGLKRNFIKDEILSELSLEYIPLYSYRDYYATSPDSSTDSDSLPERTKVIEELIKHRINAVIGLSLFNTLCSLSNTISVQRIEPLTKRKITQASNEFEYRFDASVQIVDHLDLGYMFDINTDEVRVSQGLSKTERIHKFNLTYTWN